MTNPHRESFKTVFDDAEREVEFLGGDARMALAFFTRALDGFSAELLDIETEAAKMPNPAGDPSILQARFSDLVDKLAGTLETAAAQAQDVDTSARRLLSGLWIGFKRMLVASVRMVASKLKIQSWGFTVAGGFPMGGSVSLTLTFSAM